MLDEGTVPHSTRAHPSDGKKPPDDPDSPPSPHQLSVLMLERFPVVRGGARLVHEQHPEMVVSAEVDTVASAVARNDEPDVVVHGLFLADGWGPEVVRRLRRRFRRSAIVVLTVLDHPLYVHLCIKAGATAYVTKSSRPDLLVDAVRSAVRGDRYVTPALGAALATWSPGRQRSRSWSTLTSRENELLELLALGHTNREAASALGIALRTVESHRARIFQKLGITRRADLVRFATAYTQRSLGAPTQPAPADRGAPA